MCERGVILSFGKIGAKFEGRLLSNQIHSTLDLAHRRDNFVLNPKSDKQQIDN